MLGLHNIFLLAPPPSSSSFNQQIISSSHQIPNFTINDQCNISNSQYSWANPLKRYQQESSCPEKEYSQNLACRDCGNRAKKECEFSRCRTCCRSKGFGCSTHVKSTWVPAARRKEVRRGGEGGAGGGGTSASSSGGGNKRPRENVISTSNSFSTSENNAAAAPTAFNLDSGPNCQGASFKQSLPSQVQAPAVFRCIRVTAINGGEGEVAYQAMVNISGHVFKGFLYNQGIDEKNIYPKIPCDSSGRNRDSSSPIVDPPDSYPPSATQRLLKIASR